jgi:uncharacterized protein (TIGR02646 family)
MRKIRKSHPPASLRNWIAANRDLPNFNYDALPVGVKADLKEKLISEQGFLCAYTGREIQDNASHIEHLKPQSMTIDEPGKDVDYRNVVACFPVDGGDVSCGYGAPVKGGWWDEDLFVSPLDDDCNRRFSFTWHGKVRANPKTHHAAETTIKRLGLNKPALVSLRRSAIRGFFGFGKNEQPIAISVARQFKTDLARRRPPLPMRPFCFVFEQLLPKYIAGNV